MRSAVMATMMALWWGACTTSPEKDDTADTTDTADTAETGAADLSCGLSSFCGSVSLEDEYGVKASSSVICLMELLADPVLGEVTVGTDLFGDSPRRTHLVLGSTGREVSAQSSGYINGNGGYSDPPIHCTLREAAWFEACLTEAAASDCLSPGAWLSGCTTETVCPE